MIGSKPQIVLQPRDQRLLDALSHLSVVNREQASQIAGFNSKTRANARLLFLADDVWRISAAWHCSSFDPATPSRTRSSRASMAHSATSA